MSSRAVRYTPEYSFEDYELWEGDWELWDGIPISMSPSPAPRHQLVSGNLFLALKAAIDQSGGCECLALFETDWRIPPQTVVRPDIAVLCQGLPESFIDYPPSLIVEVLSPSTEQKDRTAKRQLYENQGVNVYLIADPQKNTIEALTLHDGTYAAVPVQDDALAIQWSDDCQVSLRIPEIFADA